MKYYLLTMNADYGDEHDVPALEVFTEAKYATWLESVPAPCAYLGNSGDGFLQEFQTATGDELVKCRIVDVAEVSEAFASDFNRLRLSRLSLSNIFD